MNRLHVFNHHCLPFDSAELAEASVPAFLKLCLRANRLGFDTILLAETLDPQWFSLELASGYHFRDWHGRHGQRGDTRDLVRAFRSIATKTPLFSSEDIAKGVDLFEVIESMTSQEFQAVRAAAWLDGPLSSFPTRPPWDCHPIEVTVSVMDDAQHVTSEVREITNWHSTVVLESMAQRLEHERIEAIKSAADLFDRREEYFPFLRFCGKAPSQLRDGLQGTASLTAAKKALYHLNRFSEAWAQGEIHAYSHEALRNHGMPHEVSGESAPTLQDPDLRRLREFALEDGERVVFENHVKLPQGIRLHFHPDARDHVIHIGYIGRHLRTARY